MMADELPVEAKDHGRWAIKNKNPNETEKETEKTKEDDVTPKKTKWNIEQNIRVIAPVIGYKSSFRFYGLNEQDDVLVKDDVANKKSYNWGYLAFKNGSSYTPVYDFYLYEEDGLSACQYAYLKCLESVKFEKGYGMNIFDFSDSDLGGDGKDYEKVSELFTSDDDWYKMSCFGSRLRVDCFGNIIIMGANHQFVAIPACVNPYTWVAVDEKGSDDAEHPGGSVYNMINMMSMAYQDGKKLFTTKSSAETRIKSGTGATKALADRVESSSYKLRDHRGSDNTNLGGNIGFFKFLPKVLNTDASKALRKAMKGANANNDYCISAPWGSGFINKKSITVALPEIDGGTFAYTKKKSINFFDSMVFIDNLGAYHFDNSSSDIDWDKWEAFNVEHYIGTKEKTLEKLGTGLGSGFNSVLSEVK